MTSADRGHVRYEIHATGEAAFNTTSFGLTSLLTILRPPSCREDTMPRTKVNKAAKIRETLAKLGPSARPKDVIAELAAAKIEVSSAQVSNIKATLGGSAVKGRKNSRNNDAVSIEDLIAAKKLVMSLGSVERAQSVIAALAKLQ